MYGTSTAFGINIHMSEQYLLPMARNTVTGQTVKTQDLTGTRLNLTQRVIAQDLADQLAAKMTARTGETWQGFLESYTPRQRR
jgi:nitrate/TMAO reductase-like tetraheme cytochrome c subunit